MTYPGLPDFDHERVTTVVGERSGATITVALHSSRLGPALGGCRLWNYDSWLDGVVDALRLSSAMTLKNAAAGLNAGGGKSVIALRRGEVLDPQRRRNALLDLGDLVETFDGRYRTAEDVGTNEADMGVVAERTPHVVGLPAQGGGTGNPAHDTALGVYASIGATLEAMGAPGIVGKTITISGLGQVGGRLAKLLAADGAQLIVADVNPACRALADELGAQWVSIEEVLVTRAHVFVPAALGGVLTDDVIDALPVRAVVGPANNPLAHREGADRLAERGILYAPDFVVNAGGVIYLTMAAEGADRSIIDDRVRGIGDTLRAAFRDADEKGITPLAAAEGIAAARLADAIGRSHS
ncbi:Glu/Leu/Phe/Val dehydrogenase family protein [Agreia sp. VKM Ac-1783]|uniref:Glu/Leu/Phe/Val dehydrogenase family protein n=1 Tax=Agreia sp. VKM Ac-1783 TaxID=1938889 RepID=UPI000A2AB097|nr:Glu/Leu/Phe/Val dehydrogenase family protein [Agreia sp. VKM Ac-1783]SMQ57680.1 leucine dehydrogenase [Agreia sp. VKM Ac-1783]